MISGLDILYAMTGLAILMLSVTLPLTLHNYLQAKLGVQVADEEGE